MKPIILWQNNVKFITLLRTLAFQTIKVIGTLWYLILFNLQKPPNYNYKHENKSGNYASFFRKVFIGFTQPWCTLTWIINLPLNSRFVPKNVVSLPILDLNGHVFAKFHTKIIIHGIFIWENLEKENSYFAKQFISD